MDGPNHHSKTTGDMKANIEDRIEKTVLEAIAERRLPPGTKLGEQALSDMFSCNRANVRRALASLAAQNVVDLIPNRGAFVISPSPKDARDIFEARRAIERTVLEAACDAVTDDDLSALAHIISEEEDARATEDEPRALRLSSQFHLKLAEIAGNAVLARFLADLTMRSALIIGLYGDKSASHCDEDEHARILHALTDRDSARLIAEMDAHLAHLEADLNFDPVREKPIPLKDLLFR
ncbi:GntR family transcriptional regulator [Aliiroseovarius crassostreae]|uniref:GntR family transcriptional regulator n=1 Tax=Aliiroseovarius crassostreae TaxID=154981 RepID=UPI003C7E8780